MVNLRFDWGVTSCQMHLNLTVRFFSFQLAPFTSYRNAPKAVKGLLYRARLNLESFFQGHCSFLDINNPCTCKEWIEFMNTRNSIQKKMRQSLTVLNYKQNGYVQNTKTTQMILHYYHNIPDQRPSQKWFDGIILLVEKFYGNC